MDFLPIQPTATNKVDTSINLANDGGSKSNTGYFSSRGDSQEEKPTESFDEVKISKKTEGEETSEEEEVTKKLEGFFTKIKNFLLKLFGIKRQKIYNIFEKKSM